jgi:hypothetical protein
MSVAAAVQSQHQIVPATAIASMCGVGGEGNLRLAVKLAKVVRVLRGDVRNSSFSCQSGRRGQSMMSPQLCRERSQVGRMFASALRTGTAHRTHPHLWALSHGTEVCDRPAGRWWSNTALCRRSRSGTCGLAERRRAVSTDPLYSGGFTTSLVAPRRKTMVVRSTRMGLSHRAPERRRVVGRFPCA